MLRFASTGYMELCSLPKVKQYTWKSNVCSYGTTNRIMHTVTWAERSLSQPVFKKTFCFFFWLEKNKTTSSECKNFIGSCYKLCRFHEISTAIYEKCCPFFWYRSVQRLRTLQEKRLLEKKSVWVSVGFPDWRTHGDDESCFPVSLSASWTERQQSGPISQTGMQMALRLWHTAGTAEIKWRPRYAVKYVWRMRRGDSFIYLFLKRVTLGSVVGGWEKRCIA